MGLPLRVARQEGPVNTQPGETAKSPAQGKPLVRLKPSPGIVSPMTAFLIIGSVGLLILIASLVLGEIFDGLFEGIEAGGVLSGPVIGSFLAAFGFGAALTMYATNVGSGVGALAGLGSGVVVGGVSLLMTRNLMSMPTDEPVRSADLVGTEATVVTRIPESGIGEVSLVHRGQLMKMGARSSQAVASGARVTVVSVTSPSSVVVEPVAN